MASVTQSLCRPVALPAARAIVGGGARVRPVVVIPPDPAAPVQALSADSAAVLAGGSSNNRYQVNTTIPAGNWTLGFWSRTVLPGTIINYGPSSSPHTANSSLVIHRTTEGLTVTGKDSAGAVLGVSSASGPNVGARGIASRRNVIAGMAVFVCVRKVGSLIQLWLKWPGHSPVKAGEEFTNYGACTAQALWVGMDRSSSFRWGGHIRRLFLVSYAITDAQINEVAEGADPTAMGTYSATDFYFPTMAGGSNWVSSINSITGTPFLTGYSSTTGVGNAPLADGVYITPDSDGRVYQRGSNNRATIELSGTYRGGNGAIQVLPLDWATGVSVGNWTTVAPAATGGVWSGTITLRARAGWYKFQTRKVVAGVPSAQVVTSDLRVGVGEVVMLLGQSLMADINSTTAGGTNVAPNGLWSVAETSRPLVNGIGQEWVSITAIENDGTGKILVTTQYPHGRRTGQRVRIVGVAGTTEANAEWFITVTATNQFTLNESTFANTYASGGFVWFVQPLIRTASNSVNTSPAPAAVFCNYLTEQCGCPVMLINRSVGDTPIEAFSAFDYQGGGPGRSTLAVLHARAVERVGSVLWLHGHANLGDSGYFSSGGAPGARTGWGLLGTLYDFLTAELPNNDFLFGVAPFTSVAGIIFTSPNSIHEYRHGMADWVARKQAAGDMRCFLLGYFNDRQPVWENAIPMNSHMTAPTYQRFGARMAHSLANQLGAVQNSARGPRIVSASRAGAVITLTVEHNGGTNLRVVRDGARPSGLEVSADNFATRLPISSIALGASSITITLVSDPGGPVAVRYQWGYVGDYGFGTYFTPRITGAANNGSGAIRITTSLTPTAVSPNGSQAVGGHGLVSGDWVLIKDVAGTIEANGIWQVTVIDAENFDLNGSIFVNAFVPGSLYYAAATPSVVKELGVPIYDNRIIGGHDADGAPLVPTYMAVAA